MKKLLQVLIFLVIGLLFSACGQMVTVTPSVISSTRTPTATFTPVASLTSTATLEPTPTEAYVLPTLRPVIEPEVAHDLLSQAFSIQFLKGPNGHRIRQITGWEYGFRSNGCYSYEWLDSSHLVLYPSTGQEPSNGSAPSDVSNQPVIINLDSGSTWMPRPSWNQFCSWVYWSDELGVIISPRLFSVSPYDSSDKAAVLTYTFDGQNTAYYWGELLGISPSGNKILVADDTVIDLRSGKITELDWYINYDNERSPDLYWSSDENQVYRCCYYYAETSTGKSYSFVLSDLRQPNGKPGPDSLLPHAWGQWVRNDTYFLVEWSWVDDGDIRYLPMFNPEEKRLYEIREMAGIPEDWYCVRTVVSPDGKFVWMESDGTSYLVNLMTFEAVAYPTGYVNDFTWSPDSKFAWFNSTGGGNSALKYYLLSVSDKELKLFYTGEGQPRLEWYPSGDHFAGLLNQTLLFSDVPDLSVQEIATPTAFLDLRWSPNGNRIAFLAKDGSIWQVDYPGLEIWEKLTPPLPNVYSLNWSPDGQSVAFVGGSDIYIVETIK